MTDGNESSIDHLFLNCGEGYIVHGFYLDDDCCTALEMGAGLSFEVPMKENSAVDHFYISPNERSVIIGQESVMCWCDSVTERARTLCCVFSKGKTEFYFVARDTVKNKTEHIQKVYEALVNHDGSGILDDHEILTEAEIEDEIWDGEIGMIKWSQGVDGKLYVFFCINDKFLQRLSVEGTKDLRLDYSSDAMAVESFSGIFANKVVLAKNFYNVVSFHEYFPQEEGNVAIVLPLVAIENEITSISNFSEDVKAVLIRKNSEYEMEQAINGYIN